MINHVKFIDIMIKKYIRKYPNMNIELICDLIEEVLIDASGVYFCYDLVQDNQHLCKQCGECCKTLECKYLDGKLCSEYGSRYIACREFPYYETKDDEGLTMDPACNFSIKLAELVLDKRMKEYSEM